MSIRRGNVFTFSYLSFFVTVPLDLIKISKLDTVNYLLQNNGAFNFEWLIIVLERNLHSTSF